MWSHPAAPARARLRQTNPPGSTECEAIQATDLTAVAYRQWPRPNGPGAANEPMAINRSIGRSAGNAGSACTAGMVPQGQSPAVQALPAFEPHQHGRTKNSTYVGFELQKCLFAGGGRSVTSGSPRCPPSELPVRSELDERG